MILFLANSGWLSITYLPNSIALLIAGIVLAHLYLLYLQFVHHSAFPNVVLCSGVNLVWKLGVW